MARDKFYETEEFARLDREWSKRLRDSGFVDAEDHFAVSHRRDMTVDVYRDREIVRRGEDSGLAEHMRRAGSWLHERVFPTLTRKRIWELYAEGAPRGELCERLGTLPGHQSWYVGRQIAEECRLMDAWYATGGDAQDERGVLTLIEQEFENNGYFNHVDTRGEGGGATE